MSNAIETERLGKTFGEKRALDELNLTIKPGTVYGLLGPNGAGKTTAIRVLTTLLKPSSGKAMVLGLDVAQDPVAVRRKVSLTGQYASVDEDLTGLENLVLISRLLGMSWGEARARASELLAAFGLSEAAEKQVRHAASDRHRGQPRHSTGDLVLGRAHDWSRPA
jgi:ABC-2 type transport system ATP-binding protein